MGAARAAGDRRWPGWSVPGKAANGGDRSESASSGAELVRRMMELEGPRLGWREWGVGGADPSPEGPRQPGRPAALPHGVTFRTKTSRVECRVTAS